MASKDNEATNSGFLEALRDKPSDKATLGAYGDWLVESGYDHELGEYFLAQAEILRLQQVADELHSRLQGRRINDPHYNHEGAYVQFHPSPQANSPFVFYNEMRGDSDSVEDIMAAGIMQKEPIREVAIESISLPPKHKGWFRSPDWKHVRKLSIDFEETPSRHRRNIIDDLVKYDFKNLNDLQISNAKEEDILYLYVSVATHPSRLSSLVYLTFFQPEASSKLLCEFTQQAMDRHKPIPFPKLKELDTYSIAKDQVLSWKILAELRGKAHEMGLDKPELYGDATARRKGKKSHEKLGPGGDGPVPG